jgi:hypothetical protein
MRIWLLIIVLFGGLALALGAMIYAWTAAGIEIGLFGWLVIGVGSLVSVGLGAGLMALVFISSRRGYDDNANAPDKRPWRR